MIDINYVEAKMKQDYMKKERKITNYEWQELINRLTEAHERLTELEERVGHSELTIERLEHSEDKEYLASIERCKECIKLGINDKECRNYNNCKTKKFYEDIEKNLEERQSIYDDTCKRCSQFDTLTNECCVNANCKDEYLMPEKPCKNCKWCKNGISREDYICENIESKFWKMLVNKDESTCENWEKKSCENCRFCKVDFSAGLIRHYCDNDLSNYLG